MRSYSCKVEEDGGELTVVANDGNELTSTNLGGKYFVETGGREKSGKVENTERPRGSTAGPDFTVRFACAARLLHSSTALRFLMSNPPSHFPFNLAHPPLLSSLSLSLSLHASHLLLFFSASITSPCTHSSQPTSPRSTSYQTNTPFVQST